MSVKMYSPVKKNLRAQRQQLTAGELEGIKAREEERKAEPGRELFPLRAAPGTLDSRPRQLLSTLPLETVNHEHRPLANDCFP